MLGSLCARLAMPPREHYSAEGRELLLDILDQILANDDSAKGFLEAAEEFGWR